MKSTLLKTFFTAALTMAALLCGALQAQAQDNLISAAVASLQASLLEYQEEHADLENRLKNASFALRTGEQQGDKDRIDIASARVQRLEAALAVNEAAISWTIAAIKNPRQAPRPGDHFSTYRELVEQRKDEIAKVRSLKDALDVAVAAGNTATAAVIRQQIQAGWATVATLRTDIRIARLQLSLANNLVQMISSPATAATQADTAADPEPVVQATQTVAKQSSTPTSSDPSTANSDASATASDPVDPATQEVADQSSTPTTADPSTGTDPSSTADASATASDPADPPTQEVADQTSTPTTPDPSTSSGSSTTSDPSSTPAPAPAPAPAPVVGNAELSWSIPVTRENGDPLAVGELAGYEIYMTAEGTGVSTVIEVGNPLTTNYQVTELDPDTYHFSISAVDIDGLVSSLSPIVSKTVN